eukprot:486226-Pyramimonas_sp.AAC.1
MPGRRRSGPCGQHAGKWDRLRLARGVPKGFSLGGPAEDLRSCQLGATWAPRLRSWSPLCSRTLGGR